MDLLHPHMLCPTAQNIACCSQYNMPIEKKSDTSDDER